MSSRKHLSAVIRRASISAPGSASVFRKAGRISAATSGAPSLCPARRQRLSEPPPATAAVHLVVGVIERDGGTLYCTALMFGPDGRLLAKHRKLMPTAMERLVWGFGDGSTLAVVDTPLGRLGSVICWENYMPLLRMAMYAKGIQLYCAPTVDDRDTWLPTMRTIALEGRCFVISACQYLTRADCPADYRAIQGDDPATVLIRGGSCIVGPLGNVLVEPSFDGELIQVAELDLGDIARGKFDLDVVGHYARPDVFRLHVNEQALSAVSLSEGEPMFDQFDALLLARFQFAFTVSFHFIFPSFSIGLASYLAVLEGLWLWTGREVYLNLFKYWLKIFALAFAMGVVSGIVMSYQFGTNWSVFSDKAGPIIGPLMAYEVLTAFFLEAGFLGIMLFGMSRVGRRLHFAATLAVAVGTFISAFWILSANSWMQTPVGYAMNEAGQFVPEDWWAIVFNPSFPYRLVHTVLAAYLTTALVVGGVGAWHLLRDRGNEGARVMFSMATGIVAVLAPIQILAGDMHGLNTLEHQPAKVMAMEGHFESHPDGAPADPVRHSRPGGRHGPLRRRDPEGLLADPQARPQCSDGRARHRRPRELAQRADRLLVVPHHGGTGLPHAWARGAQPPGPVPRQALRLAPAAPASRSPWGRRASSR